MLADGKYVDGRTIRVDWATKSDFRKFGWKWTEDRTPSPSRSVVLPAELQCHWR